MRNTPAANRRRVRVLSAGSAAQADKLREQLERMNRRALELRRLGKPNVHKVPDDAL